MLRTYDILLFAIAVVSTVLRLAEAADEISCEERCTRLKHRSLNRIGYDDERLEAILERQRPLRSLKDVCWRLYDNIDCMKKCPRSEKHAAFAKKVRNKCKFVLQDMEPTLKCISKHQSFLKMRCSSFLNEASHLRSGSDLSTTPRHEECRFLHLNTICLENAVASFCANGKKIFRRLNFRDYFLSYALPTDDELFDDEDLDSCQIYDFVKNSERRQEEEEEERKEEERRKKIEEDDDEDYEEELTTIVNELEEDSPDSKDNEETKKTTKIEEIKPTNSDITDKTTQEKAEFTELIDELISSAEKEMNTTTIKPEEEGKKEHVEDEKEEGEEGDGEGDYNNHENDEEDYTDSDSDTTLITHSPVINVVSIETRSSEETTTTSEHLDLTTFSIQLTPPQIKEHDNENGNIESTLSIPKDIIDPSVDDGTEQLIEVTKPNEQLDDHSKESGEEIEVTTKKKKVFSDDSMENTPPNFFYSSLRGSSYDTTTRSNYVLDKIKNKDIEEPLEIDTSTLFGLELSSSPSPPPSFPPSDQKPKINPSSKSNRVPWLNGDVIIKPILKFDEVDKDNDEHDENEKHGRSDDERNKIKTDSGDPLDDLDHSENDEKDSYDRLVATGLIILVICLLFIICIVFITCFCNSKRDSYNVQKNSIEQSA